MDFLKNNQIQQIETTSFASHTSVCGFSFLFIENGWENSKDLIHNTRWINEWMNTTQRVRLRARVCRKRKCDHALGIRNETHGLTVPSEIVFSHLRHEPFMEFRTERVSIFSWPIADRIQCDAVGRGYVVDVYKCCVTANISTEVQTDRHLSGSMDRPRSARGLGSRTENVLPWPDKKRGPCGRCDLTFGTSTVRARRIGLSKADLFVRTRARGWKLDPAKLRNIYIFYGVDV